MVLTYLECGCAIRQDGSRAWCPTCTAGPQPKRGMMDHEDTRALLQSLSDTQKVIAEISRTLNLQAQLSAIWVAERLSQWEGVPLYLQDRVVEIGVELRSQHEYMNGGKS
jgi:hypothetical protein